MFDGERSRSAKISRLLRLLNRMEQVSLRAAQLVPREGSRTCRAGQVKDDAALAVLNR